MNKVTNGQIMKSRRTAKNQKRWDSQVGYAKRMLQRDFFFKQKVVHDMRNKKLNMCHMNNVIPVHLMLVTQLGW